MERVYNFSAGPSMLPLSVLKKASGEMLSAYGTGQSVMEMSHRSRDFLFIIETAEKLLRKLLSVPDNYEVLFLQGGATLQFSMVPVNLAGTEQVSCKKNATYIDSGIWASKAAEEGSKYVNIKIAASSKDRLYRYVPEAPAPDSGDSFYHICLNNTIAGTKWRSLPETGAVPLVADASSCILSEPLDVSRFGLIYAGAQKNLGPAGCTVVIVRRDLLGRAPPSTPVMLNYDVHAKAKSLFNTPPCYSIYMISLVLEWITETGGLSAMAKRNTEKSEMLYDCLERSKIFYSPTDKAYRSLMNVPFLVRDEFSHNKDAIEKRFIGEAKEAGLVNLAGHKLSGGLRASIYNAMPTEGVKALISFIEKFRA